MSSHALNSLSAKQLRSAATLRSRIDKLEAQLAALLGGSTPAAATGRRRRFSAATRAKMAAAQRARWAKRKSSK
jgi:hypothetical protein